MPLIRRVPKFGFHSPFKIDFQVVNVATLEKLSAAGALAGGKVNPGILYTAGAVSNKTIPIKILGDGDLKAKLEVSAHSFSKSAVKKIESAGGTMITISSAAAKK